MTVEECYIALGCDYDEILRRLGKAERVEKFLLKFIEDDTFDRFENALSEGDYKSMFMTAHTVKGIALNLGLSPLAEASSLLTENLRGGSVDGQTDALVQKFSEEYKRTVQAIRLVRE